MELTQKYKQERFNLSDSLSARAYNLLIGIVVVSGLLVNVLMSWFFTEQIMALSPIVILIAVLVGSLVFTMGIYKSKNPVISYILFLGLAVCMGLLVVFALAVYTEANVGLALLITGVITGGMMVAATIYPGFFISIG